MTKATEKAYTDLVNQISDAGLKLTPSDWIDLLEELAGHIESLKDCYREEHPEGE